MSNVDFIDRTGQLPTQAEFDEGIAAVGKYIVRGITDLPPELAISMPVILRCLQAGKAVFKELEEQRERVAEKVKEDDDEEARPNTEQ